MELFCVCVHVKYYLVNELKACSQFAVGACVRSLVRAHTVVSLENAPGGRSICLCQKERLGAFSNVGGGGGFSLTKNNPGRKVHGVVFFPFAQDVVGAFIL